MYNSLDRTSLALILVVFLCVIVFTAGLLNLLISLDEKKCLSAYSEYSPQYTFFEGCRINYKGKMTPVDIVRNINNMEKEYIYISEADDYKYLTSFAEKQPFDRTQVFSDGEFIYRYSTRDGKKNGYVERYKINLI